MPRSNRIRRPRPPKMPAELSLDLIFALILAAAAGWFAAHYLRRPQQPVRKPPSRPFSEQYFEGLNYLLNEQQDRALEVLLRMSEIDNDTVETHLALGSLYRRRGEVDRAIRVHESVMSRESLRPELREQAMYALAEDYFRAGLFDRAEALFQELTARPAQRTAALRNLLRIYEQQGDWTQAIATYERLSALASPDNPTALAHYYCELAEQARANGDTQEARRLLRMARDSQRNFPRSALIRADIALDMSQPELAARLCKHVIELHPQMLPLALQRYAKALAAMTDAAPADLVLNYDDPRLRAQLAYAGIIAGLQDETFLIECLPDYLRQDANLKELFPALADELENLDRQRLVEIAGALGRVFRRTQRYRCVECGFSTGHHFWQCPGCRSWDTLSPVTRLELAPSMRAR